MEKDAALVEFARGKIGFKQPETQAATPIGWDIHKSTPKNVPGSLSLLSTHVF
jgi:hypothetical protein